MKFSFIICIFLTQCIFAQNSHPRKTPNCLLYYSVNDSIKLLEKGYNPNESTLWDYPFNDSIKTNIIQTPNKEIITNRNLDTVEIWNITKLTFSKAPIKLQKELKKYLNQKVYIYSAYEIKKEKNICYRIIIERINKKKFRLDLWYTKKLSSKNNKYILTTISHSGLLYKNDERLYDCPYLIPLNNFINKNLTCNY